MRRGDGTVDWLDLLGGFGEVGSDARRRERGDVRWGVRVTVFTVLALLVVALCLVA
jgi:hypothetical protein